MTIRFLIVATAALATSVSAEPAQTPAEPQQPGTAKPQLLLASSDEVRAPTQPAQQSARPKARVARVTTCRCGDAPTPDQREQ